MANAFSVRDARADEWAAVRELTLAAYAQYAGIMVASAWAGLKSALLSALDSDSAERIVAVQADALIGSVMLFPPTAAAYGAMAAAAAIFELRLLAVAPQARGQGVGEALVNACITRARSRGASVLGLHTSASMQPAMRLYVRMGFVRAPADDFRPAGAEVVEAYRLHLDGAGR